MKHIVWTPGHSLAAITPNGLIVLEKGHDELCNTLWEALNKGVDLSALIHILTQAFSANLMDVPSFAAIITTGDSVHLAARGAYEVMVRTPHGTEAISAGNVISWEEKRISHALGWQISSVESASDKGITQQRPMLNGVIPVATLRSHNWTQEAACEPSHTPKEKLTTTDISQTRAYDDRLDDYAENTRVEIPEMDEPLADEATPETHAPQPHSTAQHLGESSMDDLFADRTIASHSVQAAVVRQARDAENPFAFAKPTGKDPAPDKAHPVAHHTEHDNQIPPATPVAPQAFTSPPPQHHAPTPTPQRRQGLFIDSVPGIGHPTPLPTAPQDGSDVDEATVRSAGQEYLRIHGHIPPTTPTAPTVAQTPPDTPMVVALLCANGHPNPTHINICHVCQGTLGTSTTQVPQPTLGRVYFSTGETLTLDRDIIIGRRPAYRAQPGRKEPHIVPVPSPNQEISRTHCEISINGWDVRVRDLGSNNGTFLLRPGQAPLRITEGTPSILRAGDILDLGDGVTIRMEA